jgi:hypothetical protein
VLGDLFGRIFHQLSIRRASIGGADGGDIIKIGGGKYKVSSVNPIEDENGK